jgi:1,4-dihydroxy-2-naphthoyl-CoA hydrolase
VHQDTMNPITPAIAPTSPPTREKSWIFRDYWDVATADETLTTFLHRIMPLMGVLGAEAIIADPTEVRLSLSWNQSLCTSGGVLHGGAIMALADAAGAWCAFLNLGEGGATTTIESKTNFIRAVREGSVEAVARPLHVGRTTIVVDTDLFDHQRAEWPG